MNHNINIIINKLEKGNDEAKSSTDSLTFLINDLLDYALIKQNRLKKRQRLFNI